MKNLLKILTISLCALSMMTSSYAVAQDLLDKLTSEERPAGDRARDGVRRPYQVMNLAGVEEGMTVLDISSGGGWYARVLAAAIGSSGMIYAQDLGAGGRIPQEQRSPDDKGINGARSGGLCGAHRPRHRGVQRTPKD